MYDGPAPKPEPIVVTKDAEYCGQHNLVDQSLVVGEDGSLANVFGYIYVARGKKLEVHESYEETANDEVVLDNSKCVFEPHCLTMRLSQKLIVKNSDPMGHNTNLTSREEPFNLQIAGGGAIERTFKATQSYPLPYQCNIHPWMRGHLLIREDPYMALSGGDGTFEIKNIPAGEHEFVFWQERPGTLRDLKVGDGKTDRRGRLKIKLAPGTIVDLGEIVVPAAALAATN
jgi:plastocyanin